MEVPKSPLQRQREHLFSQFIRFINRDSADFSWNWVRRGLLLGSCVPLLMAILIGLAFEGLGWLVSPLLVAFMAMVVLSGVCLLCGPREQPGRFYPLQLVAGFYLLFLGRLLVVGTVQPPGGLYSVICIFLCFASFDLFCLGIARFWRQSLLAGLFAGHTLLILLPPLTLWLWQPLHQEKLRLAFGFGAAMLVAQGFLAILLANKIPQGPEPKYHLKKFLTRLLSPFWSLSVRDRIR